MIQTTLGVEGMACGMCEAHVSDAIRRSFDVRSAKSSRRKRQCVVVSEQALDRDRVASVLGELGYELTSMTEEPCKRSFFNR
jgi:copper chaperone CopZ